jgi:hypothetical protein
MLKISEIERALENAKRQGNAEAVQKITGILNRVRPRVEARPSREEQKRQYLDSLRKSDFRVGDPSLGANIAGGFGSGFVGMGEMAALGAATLLEEEDELAARQKIQSVAEAIRPERGDPDSIAYKLASGLGSIAGIASPALLAAAAPISAPAAGAIGIGGGAALGIGAGAGEASERARAAGATEEERGTASLRGAAIGSLEVTPLGRIFRRLPKLRELFKGGGEEVTGLVGRLRSAAKTGSAEGAQEAAAGILQNLNERGYNVERALVDAGVAEEGLIGAGSGAILQGIVDAFTRGKPRGAPRTEETPATEEEIVEEEQLLGLPAPDPDKLVQVRMPDGSVQEVRASDLESARRKEQEAIRVQERRRAELDTQMDAIQRAEREDAQQRDRERGVDLPESEVRAIEERRARERAQDEQIDAFTLERDIESAQRRREAPKTEPTEQIELPIERAERDQIQREMFGPRGGIPRRAREEPTQQPRRAPEQQDMGFEQRQEQQALIGPKGGIPRRRKEPFKQPAPKAQEPKPAPDIITEERLNELGVNRSSPLRNPKSGIIGKDLNDPAIRRRLTKFSQSKKLGSKKSRANVARLLEGVSEKQGDLFAETPQRRGPTTEAGVRDAGITEPKQVPSRVSVPSAVPDVGAEPRVPSDGTGTEAVVAPEAGRVDDTGGRAGEPVRGKDAKSASLSKTDQQLLARLEDKTKPLTKEEENTIGGELTLRTNAGETVDPKLLGLFLERARGREQEIAKQEDAKKAKITGGTKSGKKATAGKEVKTKTTTSVTPAEEKKKSRTTKGVVKRGVLSRPKLFEVPADKDPVSDADVDAVESRLEEITSREKDRSKTDEGSALEAYFGRDERVIDALDRAIHDVVDESPRFTEQKGTSAETKAYFAQSGRENAKQVLAWAKKNLSEETNTWIKERTKQKKKALSRVSQRTVDVKKAEERKARNPSEMEAQAKVATQRVTEQYTNEQAYAEQEDARQQRDLDAEVQAIEEFFNEIPYELRTGDVVLGNTLHPTTAALLREGELTEALKVLASLTPNKDLARIANAFADKLGKTKVKLFSSKAKDSVAGSFDPKTNTINLNTADGISQHTLMHEVGHALTSATLANKSHPVTKQLTNLYNDVKDKLGTAYGAKNLDEFVSEAQSNERFRAELAGINPDGSNINALQRYLNIVGNLFRQVVGKKRKDIESAMTQADALINEILAPAPEYRDANALTMESTYAGVKQVADKIDALQKTVGKPLTKKGRAEFGQLGKETIDSLGEKYGDLALKFLDMNAYIDVARATNAKLGTVAQKALVAMERMRGASAQRDDATYKAIQPMERWFDSTTPEQTKLFNDIIYNREYGSTIFQVDPTLTRAQAEKKYKGKTDNDANDLWAIWQENQKQWKKLEPEGKTVYKDMQAFYRKQFEELKEVIFSRIETMADGDTQTVAKLKTEFEKKLFDRKGMDVYFPLVREGRYKIGFRYKPGKTPKGQDNFVFEMHQNRKDWLAQLREIESNPDMELVRSSDNESFVDYAKQAPSSSFVNQTLKMMQAKKVDGEVQEAFMRMVVSTLPESSLARSLQSRKNTAGHETDALYAIKTKGYDLGRQIEKLKFSGSMQNILSDLEKVSRTESEKFKPEEQWKLEQSIKDLQSRMNFAVSGAKYKEVEGVVRVANQAAFVGTIGFNTASAMVQTAQIPMVVMPMMMAKYGVKPTLQAMYRAMRLVMSARNHRPELDNLSTVKGKRLAQKATDVAGKFSPAYGLDAYYKQDGDKFVVRDDIDLSKAERKELEEFAPLVKQASDRGHLNRSFMADAVGLLEGGRAKRDDGMGSKILSGLDTGTAISAMMFNQAERFNRQVSMVLAYDLAKQEAKKKGETISEDVLIEEAFRETHRLNGGSTLETAPPVVRENIGRVAGMYKSYGMRMYTTMFSVGANALGVYDKMLKEQGLSDAEIKERVSVARKQAFGILGSSIFFSGIHGVPIYGAIQLMYDLYAGDEDDDFNSVVRDYVGEGWYKGAVNKILSEAGVGIDVASRVRLTGLIIQTNRYQTDPSAEEFIGYYLGGPALSVGKRLGRGFSDLYNGEFQRGVENLLPVGISNAYKVLGRYQQDGGIYSRRGDPIYDDITGGEMVGQFFGFAPSEYTRIQENNQRVKRIDIALSRKASELRKQYYLATRQNDYEKAREVLKEINKYNRNHPSFAITQDSIDRSMKQHMKTSTEMYNGVTLSPAMRKILDDQLEAERNGFIAP